MKFMEDLEAQMRVKWRPYYINYHALRQHIEDIECDPSASNMEFIRQLKVQLLKVLHFYSATEKRLQAQVREALLRGGDEAVEAELIREAEQLRMYASLNVLGLRKIAKKYDKKCGRSKTLQADIMESLQLCYIADADRRIDSLLEMLEKRRIPRSSPTSPTSELAEPLLADKTPVSRKSKHFVDWIFQKHERIGFREAEKDVGKSERLGSLQELLGFETLVMCMLLFIAAALYISDLSPHLDWRSYVTLFVTLESLHLLIQQNPPDVILIFATLVLRIFGILDDDEAWSGFSNGVVLSVAVLGIVSAGVHRTGVLEYLLMHILGRPTNYAAAMVRLCVPALVLNTAISNTCLMGIIVPVIETWSKDIDIHPALFLMPMSYLLLVGGTFAIFSTSSNLITQGLLLSKGLQPMGNFEIAPLTCVCTFAALVYLVLTVPFFLDRFVQRSGQQALDEESPLDKSKSPRFAVSRDMKLFVANLQIVGASLHDRVLMGTGLPQLFRHGQAGLIRLERMGEEIHETLDENTRLQLHDVLWVWTTADSIVSLLAVPALRFMALDAGFENYHTNEDRAIVEVVLDGLCPLVKENMSTTKQLETSYNANCLAVRPCMMQHFLMPEARAQEVHAFVQRLRHAERENPYCFHIGDNLLLDVPLNFYRTHQDSAHFTSVRIISGGDDDGKQTSGEAADGNSGRNMLISGIILLGMVLLVSNKVPLLVAALLATFALVSFGCLPLQCAFDAINIRTILGIVGAFGIARAIGKTELARVLAHFLCNLFAPLGDKGLFAGILMSTVALGVVFSLHRSRDSHVSHLRGHQLQRGSLCSSNDGSADDWGCLPNAIPSLIPDQSHGLCVWILYLC